MCCKTFNIPGHAAETLGLFYSLVDNQETNTHFHPVLENEEKKAEREKESVEEEKKERGE